MSEPVLYDDGWQKDMAITWGAFFSALAVGAVREEERAEFMKFVAMVSNPVVYITGIKGDKA